MAGSKVHVGPADEVEEHRRRFLGIDLAQRAVRDSVAQDALQWLREDAAGQHLTGIFLMKGAVRLHAQGEKKTHVLLGERAMSFQRLSESLGPRAFSGQCRPEGSTVILDAPLDQLREQAVLADAAPVQSDARNAGLFGYPLNRGLRVAARREDAIGRVADVCVWNR